MTEIKPDPYDVCPTYESESFLLCLVAPEDDGDLSECYKDPVLRRSLTCDHWDCTYHFNFQSFDGWRDAYKKRRFTRFSVIDKRKERVIGSVEIFGGDGGILRMEVIEEYENKEYISELVKIADSFFDDFKAARIITRAIPEAVGRIAALTKNGYAPYPSRFENYYAKRSPDYDPYVNCPAYWGKRFYLRLVSPDDAFDLLKCYGDPEARKFFNSDNCNSDFYWSTEDDVRAYIEGWISAYKNGGFIRYSVIDRQINQVIGTIEIFGGKNGGLRDGHGILRIDVRSEYENEESLGELLVISDQFFYDFNSGKIITKAIPEAAARRNALAQNGYAPTRLGDGANREHYFMKESPR